MYCSRKVTEDLIWVGANDRRLAMFEGVYSVPLGVSYNSYLLLDEKTVLFDSVDKAVRSRFLENVEESLNGRSLDYLVIQHMEPDHSSAIVDLLQRYPEMTVVANQKIVNFFAQFFNFDISARLLLVDESSNLNCGKHNLYFIMAPMVHWPEVMMTYDSSDKILFSADAFGCFGALNGALFADEVNFEKDYLDEARRYYGNIVGKYGNQVYALLKKTAQLAIKMICPLHGFVWRQKLQTIISKYQLWCNYQAEQPGVLIAYASVYGNTENAAEILACQLRDNGIKTAMFDVSVTPLSEIVAATFYWSHLVFASTTYNAGIFITMEELLNDLVAHNLQNRTVAIIENGSWAATSGALIKAKLEKCKNLTFLENTLSIKSSLKTEELTLITALATELIASLKSATDKTATVSPANNSAIDYQAMFKLSYGLFVLSARDQGVDNACIINTVTQITEKPLRITIAVNKSNLTHDMIVNSKQFCLSVLNETVPFSLFVEYGFNSGRDIKKFNEVPELRCENGVRYLNNYVNAVMAAKVLNIEDYGSHSLFVAEVNQAFVVSGAPSVTYQYYFDNIKPKPGITVEDKKAYVCQICGYVYEGEELPADFICPLCKHGVEAFKPVKSGE